MSIISAVNREQAIVTNIKQTLQQLKQGGKVNVPLVIDGTGVTTEVFFFTDAERTILLFADSSEDHPERFTTKGTKTFYSVPDSLINFAAGISEQYCQTLYYVTTDFFDDDGDLDEYLTPVSTKNQVYRNIDNLVFQSVIVTTKPGAKFATNENVCMIYPRPSEGRPYGGSDDLIFEIITMDLYMQLLVFNWSGLSEELRWQEAMNVSNLIKNSLYADPTRDDNCTLLDKDLQGTDVDQIQVFPSDDVLKAKITVKCCYRVSSTTY